MRYFARAQYDDELSLRASAACLTCHCEPTKSARQSTNKRRLEFYGFYFVRFALATHFLLSQKTAIICAATPISSVRNDANLSAKYHNNTNSQKNSSLLTKAQKSLQILHKISNKLQKPKKNYEFSIFQTNYKFTKAQKFTNLPNPKNFFKKFQKKIQIFYSH